MAVPAPATLKVSLATTPLLEARLDSTLDTFNLSAGIEFPIASVIAFSGTAGVDLPQILADSGAIAEVGIYDFHIFMTCQAALDVAIEHRDAANTSTLESLVISVPANDPRYIKLRVRTGAVSERLRLTLQTEPANLIATITSLYGRRVL